MRSRTAAFLLLTLVLSMGLIASSARADDAVIGFVKTLSGHATLTRDAVVLPVALSMPLHEKDRLETAADGRLGISFRDDTRISLGPDSRVELPSFVFKPAEKRYDFILRLAFGTMQYLSGLTAKLAPDAMAIKTPTVTIAVRGTRFLARAEKQP